MAIQASSPPAVHIAACDRHVRALADVAVPPAVEAAVAFRAAPKDVVQRARQALPRGSGNPVRMDAVVPDSVLEAADADHMDGVADLEAESAATGAPAANVLGRSAASSCVAHAA